MSGVFSKPKPPAPDPAVLEAQKRQEQRAEEALAKEEAVAAARKNVRSTGGIKQLMSPTRIAEMAQGKTKLGGGS